MAPEQEKKPDLSGYRSSFRLLGNCPNCRAEDTIVQPDIKEVICENCQTSWPDWLNLVWEEKEKGNKLIPVGVERQCYSGQEYGVCLTWPSTRLKEVPNCGLIASVLNAALIKRFKMDVCFATEGGVQGVYKGEYIELRNAYDSLGLVVDQHYRQGPGLVKILDFYERMLRLTFEEEFRVGQKKFYRGQILKCPPEEQTTEKTWEVLIGVLVKVRNRQFAQDVIKTITNASPLAQPYFRGLNTQEIVDFFVPPKIG